jgi:serine/threonine protein kinase
VHCDLKPSNILVLHGPASGEEEGGEGRPQSQSLSVKLADFGLSQTLQRADPEIKRRSRKSSSGTPSPLRPGESSANLAHGPDDSPSPSFDDLAALTAGDVRRSEEEGPPILTDVCGTPEYFAPELVRLHQGESIADGGYNAKVRLAAGCWLLAAPAAACSPHAYDLTHPHHPSPSPTTPHHPSPHPTRKVDCWCCGCIVYELLSGEPPFSAKSEDVLFYKILENQIEFPKQARLVGRVVRAQ